MISQKVIGPADRSRIRNAIGEAEKLTSGEIRIFIEDHTADTALDRAVFLFEKLEMHKTELRNGILFYIAIKDHTFSVIGDYGIHEKVGEDFWNRIRDRMQLQFMDGNISEGIIEGIMEAGKALGDHFPRRDDDVNELPDDIVFGKGDI